MSHLQQLTLFFSVTEPIIGLAAVPRKNKWKTGEKWIIRHQGTKRKQFCSNGSTFFFPANIIRLCFSFFQSFSTFLWVICNSLRCFFQWQSQSSSWLLFRAKTSEKIGVLHCFSVFFFLLCCGKGYHVGSRCASASFSFSKEVNPVCLRQKGQKKSFHSDVTRNIRARLFLSEIPKSQISNISEINEIMGQKSDSTPWTFCFPSHIKKVWNAVCWKFSPFLGLEVNSRVVFWGTNTFSRANSCFAICPNKRDQTSKISYFRLVTWRVTFLAIFGTSFYAFLGCFWIFFT